METPYTPLLTASATAGHMDTQSAQTHPETQRQYRTHRCASCNTPYPFQAFETKTFLDGFGVPAWTIAVNCLGCTAPAKAQAIFQYHADAVEVDFRKLFPDGIHCVQDLRLADTANPPNGPEDPEEAKKREAEEIRRIKKDKRKEASGRAKQKEMAWREEIARIEMLRKNAPQQTPVDPHPAPTQPLQAEETPAIEATGDTTTSDSGRHTPPTATQPPRDIQLRIQQYQDRRLLEEKEKDEQIAKENARREEQLLAEARIRWENEQLAKEEARAEAVRQSAVAVHEIRMRQEMAQQAEKANAERERARLAEEQANDKHLIRQQHAQKLVNQQQADELARRARDQEQAMNEQTALEQSRRNQIQDRIRLEQDQVRRDQQIRDQMAGLEQARRQQALFAQRQQAQREEEQARREQAIRERNQREQAQREHAQREQAQREQAQREQAQREQAQREQAQQQLARERAQREQAEEQKRRDLAQLARERAQREQAEEQKRRDLAQRQQQLARERAQREQAEEQKRREVAQAQALAQEQARRAQAEEIFRRQTERAATEAAEKLAKQNAIRAESLLSQTQGSQHRSSFSDFQADSQYQESPPIQSIRIPPSADTLSASGAETFSGQRNLPSAQASSQLVNSNVMMELHSAMISVQSQIIATQSKLYGLQNELNGPERSILKHVQHNLLTEQLQSMVSMYNKIQLQLASRQQPPPQAQRPAPAQYAQEPSYASQSSHTTHQHIPNPPRPQQVVRPPLQPQQAFSAPPARPTQQSRPQQASAWQQIRSDTQPSAARGSFSNGNSGMTSARQADIPASNQVIINGHGSNLNTRQPSANSQTGQSQAPVPSVPQRPAQRPVLRQDNAPPPQQMRPHANQDVSVPLMRGGQPEQPSLMSLYPKPGAPRTDKQPQSLAIPLQPNDHQARAPSSTPSTSHAQSKSPPAQNAAQMLHQQTTAERPSPPEESNTQMVPHSKMQNHLEPHNLAAKAQLLKAQQIQQMQLAQMARPPMGMGGLSGAMLMDGLRPVQGVSSVPSALETRSVPTSLVPAPMAMPFPFDPFTPGAMDSSPFLIGDVNDMVPLPAASPEDASRFTEVLESPNGKTASQPTSDVSNKPLSSSQVPVKATESISNSNGGVRASPAPIAATHENSTSSTVREPTPPVIPADRAETVQQASSKETATSLETPNSPGPDGSATIVATVQSPKPVSPSAESSAPPAAQVTVAEQSPQQPVAEPPTQAEDIVPEHGAEIVDNKTSRTRQRSESGDEHAVKERPTKRRRTDQSRFMPPREDLSLSPNRGPSARDTTGSEQRRADKPSWKAMSDSSDTESETEAATVTATTTVVLDQPVASTVVDSQAVDAAPSTAPTATPSSQNVTSPSSSQQAAKASSVRLTLEKVFQKNPHPSDAVFDKLAMALKIEDVEPVKKLFALWRQNGHQPNTGLQA